MLAGPYQSSLQHVSLLQHAHAAWIGPVCCNRCQRSAGWALAGVADPGKPNKTCFVVKRGGAGQTNYASPF